MHHTRHLGFQDVLGTLNLLVGKVAERRKVVTTHLQIQYNTKLDLC